MNTAVIKLLTEALSSGEYKEIAYPMHTTEGFDLGGVLTDLFRKQFGGSWVPEKNWCTELDALNYRGNGCITRPIVFLERFEFLGNSYMPPTGVVQWLDLKCSPRLCSRNGPRNDPHITHHASCEGNRFFLEIIESKVCFAEKAIRLKVFSNG